MKSNVPKYALLFLLLMIFAFNVRNSVLLSKNPNNKDTVERIISSVEIEENNPLPNTEDHQCIGDSCPTKSDSRSESYTIQINFARNFSRTFDTLAPGVMFNYAKMTLEHQNDFTTDAVLEKIQDYPPDDILFTPLLNEFKRTTSGPLQKKLYIELSKYGLKKQENEVNTAMAEKISQGPLVANQWFLKNILTDLNDATFKPLKAALLTTPKNHPNHKLLEYIVNQYRRLKSAE